MICKDAPKYITPLPYSASYLLFRCSHELFEIGQLESNKLQINPNERIGIYIADKILKHEKIQIIFSVGAQLYVNSILSIKR